MLKSTSKLPTVIPTTPYVITLQQAEKICSTTYVAGIDQLSQEALETEQHLKNLSPADVLMNEVKSFKVTEMPVFDAPEKTIQIEKNEKLLKKRTKIVPNVFLRNKNQDDTNLFNNKNITKTENSLKKNDSFQVEMPVLDATEKKTQTSENEKLLKKRTKILPKFFFSRKDAADSCSLINEEINETELVKTKSNCFQKSPEKNVLTAIFNDKVSANEVVYIDADVPGLDAPEKKTQTSENEKLLKKRTKILPKVFSSRKNAVDRCSLVNEEIRETELVNTKSNSFQKSLEKNVLTAVSNDKVSANEVVYIDADVPGLDAPEKKTQTSENEKLLKKRTKILPKVFSSRKVAVDSCSSLINKKVNEAEIVKTKSNSFQKSPENCTSTTVSMDKVFDPLSNKCNSIDLLSNKEVDKTENDVNNKSFQKSPEKNKLVDVSETNSMNKVESLDVDFPGMYVPEKKKHVRFNHQSEFEDKATEVVKTQKEKLMANNNDIHSDYSSQSDGEVSSKLTVSGKKVFRPNFELQRRKKRLSSFSAYSSCDEAEEEVQKKKKKKQVIIFFQFKKRML